MKSCPWCCSFLPITPTEAGLGGFGVVLHEVPGTMIKRGKEALVLPRGAVATQVGKTTGKLSKTSGWPLLKVATSRTRPSEAEISKKESCQPVSALKPPLTCTFFEHLLGLLARDDFFPPSSFGSK